MNLFKKLALPILILVGFVAPYLSRPWLDTFVITLLPLCFVGLLITVPVLSFYAFKRRPSPKAFKFSLLVSLACGAPFLGWLVGNQIFEPEAKWKVFVYNKSDNGLSHKQMGSYVSAEGCRAAGQKFLALPTTLSIQGCTGNACLADHFMCGLDCGIDPEHDSSFITGFICKEKFDEDIMLGF